MVRGPGTRSWTPSIFRPPEGGLRGLRPVGLQGVQGNRVDGLSAWMGWAYRMFQAVAGEKCLPDMSRRLIHQVYALGLPLL